MFIVPKRQSSERFTVLNQHFTYLASFSRFRKSSKTQVFQRLQLREVLDGADHLAGVAVLVRRRSFAPPPLELLHFQALSHCEIV